jgi:rhamnosyltransferase
MRSILAQRGVRLRIAVSVDPSSDGTRAWFEQFADRDPRCVLLPAEGPSGGAAQNFLRLLRTVDLAAADFVALADQDDVWRPEKLERAITILQRTSAAAYSSNVVAFWPDGRRVLISKAQPQNEWDYLFESPGPGCTFVFSARFARGLQEFLLSHHEQLRLIELHDWLIYAFARQHGFRWHIDDYVSLDYRQHARNVFGANKGWAAFSARAAKSIKGWHLGQARATAIAIGADKDPFVRRTLLAGPWGSVRLAAKAGRCRRRPKDQLLFGLSCLADALRRTLPSLAHPSDPLEPRT